MFNIRSREEGNGRGRKLIDTCFQEGKIVKSKKRGARVSLRSDRWIPIAWEWTAVHSPPRGLSYVSHFDVSRQHVTRVFTNGGRRACEGRGGGGGARAHARARTSVAKRRGCGGARHAYEEAMNFTSVRATTSDDDNEDDAAFTCV